MKVGLELSNDGTVMLWRPIDKALLTVGSDFDCDLCVPDPSVEPIQFLLRLDAGALTLKNSAAAGTRVGDERVDDELRMAAGDTIHLGPISALVKFVRDEASCRRGATRTLTSQPEQLERELYVTLPEIVPGKRWRIDESGLTIGHDPSNDIEVDDQYVTSEHAIIRLENGRCIVRDLESRNGVFVGNTKVVEAEVLPGMQVRLGQTVVVVTTRDAKRRSPSEPEATRTPLVGSSQAMQRLRDRVRQVAPSDAAVLITGPSGVGKELVAHLIAELGSRASAPFVPINCGALAANLIDSELFGHERGAFTGAVARRKGAFEAADGGVLFLDEIGELPLSLQPQLLRVLENGEVRRVGATDTFRVNVRLIAATNCDLPSMISAGKFRSDLFYRLHVVSVVVPSLNERRDDIPELANHFVDGASPDGHALKLTDAAVQRLMAHDWTGNVRELRNVLEAAVLLRRVHDRVDADDITFTESSLETHTEIKSGAMGKTLAEIERDAIIVALIRHRGNRKDAAVSLGISRSKLYRDMLEYDIDLENIGAIPKKKPARFTSPR